MVVRPSRRRVLKALQALPLQALHLAYETGPSETYDAPAWASGRPSRVVVSSAAGLIITVTDSEREGEVIEREAGSRVRDRARPCRARSRSTLSDLEPKRNVERACWRVAGESSGRVSTPSELARSFR